MEYKCNKCKDRLYILKDDIAYECECKSLREAERILELSGISEEFKTKTFENFNYKANKEIATAFTLALSYCKNFDRIKDNRRNSILFMGQPGSGKTHLSIAIANKLIEKHISVIYMQYRDIITILKQTISNDPGKYQSEINKYKNAKVILIDDLFKGNITKSDINIMFEIINHRYLKKLPTIISTEKTFEELIDIDEAIGSRIIEMSKDYIMQLVGKKLNYRIYGS
ncbi:DNA replication protein DnaC [[Clostridium] sordellii]|nr:DNA replication protein DnaC [[Clostridium] sordellii] [Paeniclostridium sordellii]